MRRLAVYLEDDVFAQIERRARASYRRSMSAEAASLIEAALGGALGASTDGDSLPAGISTSRQPGDESKSK